MQTRNGTRREPLYKRRRGFASPCASKSLDVRQQRRACTVPTAVCMDHRDGDILARRTGAARLETSRHTKLPSLGVRWPQAKRAAAASNAITQDWLGGPAVAGAGASQPPVDAEARAHRSSTTRHPRNRVWQPYGSLTCPAVLGELRVRLLRHPSHGSIRYSEVHLHVPLSWCMPLAEYKDV